MSCVTNADVRRMLEGLNDEDVVQANVREAGGVTRNLEFDKLELQSFGSGHEGILLVETGKSMKIVTNGQLRRALQGLADKGWIWAQVQHPDGGVRTLKFSEANRQEHMSGQRSILLVERW